VKCGKGCHFNSRHVNDHQDDKRDFADLTGPEQVNVLADHSATAALDELRAAGQTTEFYAPTACRCYLRDGNGYITSREIRTLRTKLAEYELRDYLQKGNEWSDEVYDSIGWSAYRSATAGLTDSIRTFVIKLSQIETAPHLYCYHARGPWHHWFLIHLHGHLTETKTAADRR
jgi:hypothetical protein